MMMFTSERIIKLALTTNDELRSATFTGEITKIFLKSINARLNPTPKQHLDTTGD